MKNWKKVFMMVLVLSLVTMMFIGCQQPAVQEDPEDNSEGVEEPEKITVTDVTGRELTFDKPATKVVGTHNPSLNAVVVLGEEINT